MTRKTRTTRAKNTVGTAIVTEAHAALLTSDPTLDAHIEQLEEIEACLEAGVPLVEIEAVLDEPALTEDEVHTLEAEEPEVDDDTQIRGVTFDELRESFADEVLEATALGLVAVVDERMVFELGKNPDNENIQRTLKKVREQLGTKRAAKVLLATNTNPAFVNRTLHDGSRYNVYALGKLADIVRGVTDGAISNAINNACMRSLFRCAKAGVAFTGELAKAAASDKIRVDAAVKQHLVRHTVSASTAPTQAGSTMQALETLGVVKVEGSRKNPTYKLTDHPIVSFLDAKLAA